MNTFLAICLAADLEDGARGNSIGVMIVGIVDDVGEFVFAVVDEGATNRSDDGVSDVGG